MNEINKILIKRRTIRKYKREQISQEELNEILEGGLHAPNVSGGESVFYHLYTIKSFLNGGDIKNNLDLSI